MKGRSQLLTVLTAAFLLVLFPGCSKKQDKSQEGEPAEVDSSSQISHETDQNQPDSGNDEEAAAQDISLTETVALWVAGQKDAAKAKFASIDWRDASILEQVRGLSMSEKDLVALSADERNRVVQETMDLLSSMRKLFFEIAADAERLGASGDTAKAKEYLESIRQYGESLSGADHLEVVKLHGKAAMAYAEKRLSDLQ